MANPEFGPSEERKTDRLNAQHLVGELNSAIEEFRFCVRDVAWNSIVSNAEEYFPEEVHRLKQAVAATRGLPIEGRTTATSYYAQTSDGYKRGPLGLHHGTLGHYFEGVVQSVGEIPTPTMRENQMRLCIGIGSLSFLLGDMFDPEMDAYYKLLGRESQLRHPFAHEQHRDEVIFLPVDSADEREIKLLQHWKTS
jgi:hypothetical protein